MGFIFLFTFAADNENMQLKMENITKDYKPKQAKALLIGHDPTLQNSEKQADVTLFADLYFKYKDEEPKRWDEKRKFKLAQQSFEQIAYITSGKIKDDEIYITNLCNTILYKDKSDVGKTVRIPESKAKDGVERIREILKNNPTIKYVFPMSLQVNYWLQELGLYNSNDNFLNDTRPIKNDDDTRVFKPKKQKTFLSICGKRYKINGCGEQIIIPILHTKQFSLNKKTKSYNDCYESIRSYFESIEV